MVMELSEADHARVSEAIAAAEAKTDGEIVAVATPRSDAYHDVALHWSVAVLILVLAWAAWQPGALQSGFEWIFGGWSPEPSLGQLLTLLMIVAVVAFTVALLILKWMPLRLALTPSSTKHRRVRRRAVLIFRTAAERRTADRTGILIYLSMAERRAEIVADEAVTKVTTPDTWGEAMAALLDHVREGRPGEGICAAVEQVGAVLAQHFPKTATNPNEIPDKLIEL